MSGAAKPGRPRKYTIVLLYPDYTPGGDKQPTFTVHVEGRTTREALTAARRACQSVNPDLKGRATEMRCLFACAGHVDALGTD